MPFLVATIVTTMSEGSDTGAFAAPRVHAFGRGASGSHSIPGAGEKTLINELG